MNRAAQAVGAVTVAYSVAIVAAPSLLAKPCGMTSPDGSVPKNVALLIRAVGARDAAIGAAMIAASTPEALRLATAARVASDASDAVTFGLMLDGAATKAKIAGFAAAWAALSAWAGFRPAH